MVPRLLVRIGPFVTLEVKDPKIWDLARSFQRPREQFAFWPYRCKRTTFIVAVYARSFLSPWKFQPDGLLITDHRANLITDRSKCERVLRDFSIWLRLYFHPVIKRIPMRQRYFSKLRDFLKSFAEDCRKRYDSDDYKTEDPAKRRYKEILRELDKDVVENHSLLIENLNMIDKIIQTQDDIFRECSCEGIDKLRGLLTRYKSICQQMANRMERRAEIFYDYERSIRDAYLIDLQISKYSLLSKGILSFLLWLMSVNPYALAVPFIPEALKIVYQALCGYRSLVGKSVSFLGRANEISSLLDLFTIDIEEARLRNIELS